MAFKIFRPGSNKLKYPTKTPAPTNSQTTSTGITFVPTKSGTITIPGPWMSVPVGKGWNSSSAGSIPLIDLDIDLPKDRDGLNCIRCKEFYPYAVSNQEDGKTLICFSCRNGY
jgi:hypothetical protein